MVPVTLVTMSKIDVDNGLGYPGLLVHAPTNIRDAAFAEAKTSLLLLSIPIQAFHSEPSPVSAHGDPVDAQKPCTLPREVASKPCLRCCLWVFVLIGAEFRRANGRTKPTLIKGHAFVLPLPLPLDNMQRLQKIDVSHRPRVELHTAGAIAQTGSCRESSLWSLYKHFLI